MKSLKCPSPSDPPLSDADSLELVQILYCSLVSSLMYLAVGTQADISFTIARLCQFLDCYHQIHWNAAICVIHYLKGTRLLTLSLGGNPDLDLVGFSDSSHADCPDTAHSTMGYCFSVGGAIFTWSSHCQKTVSDSSCEAEYIALSEASCKALWLCQFLCEVHLLKPHPTILLCDNNSAKSFSSNPTHHSRSKHIDVCHHFICERVDNGSLTVWRVPIMTMLRISSLRHCPILTSLACGPTLDFGDVCARRSILVGVLNFNLLILSRFHFNHASW